MKYKLSGYLTLLFFLNACGAYQLDQAQSEIRTSFASGEYSKTAELISSFEEQEVYQGKDAVLLNLEQGTINHFAGNYEQSSRYFTAAEDYIDDLYTKSVSRAIQSFVVNDNTLAYDGEDYEDIYINVFKSLNYIHLNKLESALVEARRVAYKLNQLDIKYNGLVESLAQADTTSTQPDKWKTGKTNIQKSPLGHYLSAVLFAKTNKPDDARIEYQNLLKAYEEHTAVFDYSSPDKEELEVITRPNDYNMLLTVFSGRSPVKLQNDIRLYLEDSDTYLKFSLPTLDIYDSQVHKIEAVVNNSDSHPIPLIEEMDLVATEVYKVKEPIIYARTMVRTFLKAITANELKKSATKEDETLGMFVNALGKIAQETTEKADLRSWQTMPGKAYAKVLQLQPGENEIQVRYYNRAGRLIYTDKQTFSVTENDKLNLFESIYWN